MAINRYAAGNGTAGDVLEFMTNGGDLYYWQNPYSASGPASDTASTGGLSVGAIDPAAGTAIAVYSSQGPTNDALYPPATARIKPDLSAASCVASYTYAPDCFNGTSASTPVVAGAAALIIGAGLANTPTQVKTYLLSNAVVDRGAAGPDNLFGAGELILGTPPAPTATPTPTRTATLTAATRTATRQHSTQRLHLQILRRPPTRRRSRRHRPLLLRPQRRPTSIRTATASSTTWTTARCSPTRPRPTAWTTTPTGQSTRRGSRRTSTMQPATTALTCQHGRHDPQRRLLSAMPATRISTTTGC